ncbi:MAG: S41 family peptidase [Ginsengibacter sp.]
MKTLLPLLFFILFSYVFVSAQELNSAVKNAYIITRMAEKFHFQPKPLNDEFSLNIFNQLLEQLDKDRIFFTGEDIKELSKFKFDLDDQVKNRQSQFLSAITKAFTAGIISADSMISNICKTPFNFTLPETLTITEDTSYPADKKAMHSKLYKLLKSSVLAEILEDDRIFTFNSSQQKKLADSLEPIARYKVQKAFKHPINIMLKGSGGIQDAVGNEYCKAIAVCYDPHTEYFPLTEKENFESQLGQQQMVFGFNFKEEDNGAIKIESIAPGSPAFKSGQINKGDELVSVQWEDKQPMDVSSGGLKQLVDVLEMSNHDKATLNIKKQDGSERSVVLFKEKMEDDIEQNKVKSFVLKGSKAVGFISLPAFYEDWENEDEGIKGCANDVAKEILKLKKENIEGLIIDLRYNGGGSMQEAIELSGIFIDAGPVGQYKGKNAKIYTLKDINRGTIYDGPLMLMVNGYSASASEMVAGTLQDYHRAVIIGTPTYGKATAQIVMPMDTTVDLKKDISAIKTDSYLKVTVSQLYKVNGTTAQAHGVQPDIVLPDILEANPQREGDNPNVLISAPIEANKYFTPYPVADLSKIKALVKTKTDASFYFQWLKSYIDFEKTHNQKKDVSLKLSDAIKENNEVAQKIIYTASIEREKASYTVQNNSFEKKQLEVNVRLKAMNDQWTKFLSDDPYLQIAYDTMLLLIK